MLCVSFSSKKDRLFIFNKENLLSEDTHIKTTFRYKLIDKCKTILQTQNESFFWNIYILLTKHK